MGVIDEILRLTLQEVREMDARLEALARQAPGQLKPLVISPNGSAVAGYDGELFILQGSNRWERHYIGPVDIHPDWFDAWGRLFAYRQAEAERRGVTLWNLVVPEKQVVIPEKRWAEPQAGESRPFRRLLERLDASAQLYYPAADLIAAKAQGPVYFARNSHWCGSGCLTAATGLLAAMGVGFDPETRFAYHHKLHQHDLPKHFFADPPWVEMGVLVENGAYTFENRPLEKTGRLVGSCYGIRNPAAPDPRRLIIFGDSFSYDAGLAGALSAIFAETLFYWSKDVIWGLVEQHRAEVVLWESAERFMVTLPRA